MEHVETPEEELTRLASLNADGSRRFIYPADVSGRFARLRKIVFVFLIGLLVALPWLRLGGEPALLLDVQNRRFFLLGAQFNAQDAWLMFFLVTGVGFILLATTAIWGRVWCGWACPQTVFIEGIYRRIERWIEGPAGARARLDAAPMSATKALKRGAKHVAFLAVSLLLAHVVLGYFVRIDDLLAMVKGSPAHHPEAFAWVAGMTALVYFNFGFFREQFCVIMCPYGRLQGVLTDPDSLVVGYDEKRGEPRGKVHLKVAATEKKLGDCVDCKRCVAVCPTGIDIRQGQQLDCIACTACIDACDDIMVKVGRPTGLIRYDSLKGFRNEKTQYLRPRTYAYAFAGLLGLSAMTLALSQRQTFEANLIRSKGAPFVLEGADVRNQFHVHVMNKSSTERKVQIEPLPIPGAVFLVSQKEVTLLGGASADVPVFVTIPLAEYHRGTIVKVRIVGGEDTKIATAQLLGPG
jgi:cytochrome c oxidase accessory protein FixG